MASVCLVLGSNEVTYESPCVTFCICPLCICPPSGQTQLLLRFRLRAGEPEDLHFQCEMKMPESPFYQVPNKNKFIFSCV